MCPYLGPGNDVELQFLIDQAGPGLREVTLVQDQTVATKAAGTTQFLEPLSPLGVQLAIWLFILRFEHTNDFLWREAENENQETVSRQRLRIRKERRFGCVDN